MGRIVLARAGSTDFDDQHRLAGTLDLPLSVKGEGEASLATAEKLGHDLDVKVKQLDDLRNQDFGLWQGAQVDDLRRKHPRVFKQWEDSPCSVCPPNGEMVEQVLERINKSLRPILKKHAGETIAIVAPDPLRRVIGCYLKRRAPECPVDEAVDHVPLWEVLDVTPPGATEVIPVVR
jgi:broad specificity phosphatase PhoE